MLIDEYEPMEIEVLIKQSSPETTRTSLNKAGFSDYLWYTKDGLPEQVERKQVAEILGGFEKVEYQLGDEIAKQPNLVNQILIVEGIAQATTQGIQTWIMHHNAKYYRKAKLFKTPMARFESWLISHTRAGILVWRTESWMHTAEALIHFERSAMVDSSAMSRHLKIRPSFRPNPYMEQVMGIADVGPKLAEQLLEIFHTPWDIYRQTPEMLSDYVPGIGIAKARAILKGIGKKI